jgi:hypothetical protein
MPNRFEQSADLAIAPLRNRDPVPTVGALTTAIFDRTKLSVPIVKGHSCQQTLFFFLA